MEVYTMTSMRRRLLCFAIMFCLLVSIAPVTGFAISPDMESAVAESKLAEVGGVGKIGSSSTMDIHQGASTSVQNSRAGELIDRDLYYSDFSTREYVVQELRDAMIERKNEIYLYYVTDVELTEADIDALMADAFTDGDSVLDGDYLYFHVVDYIAFWEPIIDGGRYYNVIGFGVVYSTTAEQEQALADKINELRPTICDGKVNDYQKIKSIYDYILTNVVYDLENVENLENVTQHTAYGALTDGKASAIGYTLLFYRMANAYNIDTELVVGTIDGNMFFWTVVKLYDQWYQMNLGMDALLGTQDCFLRGYEDLPAGYVLAGDYLTPEFQAEYPFAKTRFVPEEAAKGSAGANIIWSFDAATATLSFSGTGKMADQKTEWGGSPWFEYIDGGAHVVIGEGITYIGASSFWNRSLLSLQLPVSLEIIGSGAFSTTSGLKELVLPKNVKRLEQYAFYSSELEKITFPEGLVSIGNYAFANSSKLAAVKLPDSLTTIGDNAFSDSGLTEITIPRNVTVIGNGAFASAVEKYNGYDYANLVAVTKYMVHPDNAVYSAKDGLLLSKDGTKLLAVPNDKKGTFVVPEGITEIGDGAFQYCEQLKEIILPEGLTKIGEKAFLFNKQLTNVEIPNSVTEIGAYAFQNCRDLLSVKLPQGLTEISEGLFQSTNLRAVQIPDSVTVIRKDAFQYTYLYSVALPESLKTVEAGAFRELRGDFGNSFTDVFYAGTQAQWEGVSIGKNNSLTDAMVQFETQKLREAWWVFDITDGSLEILNQDSNAYPWKAWPEDVKSVYWNVTPHYNGSVEIGAGMFKDCSNLTTFTMNDEIKYEGESGRIGAEAFYGCSALQGFTVPGSVRWIGEQAFANCTNLQTVDLSRNIYSIEANAFAGCSALTDVYVDQTEEEWQDDPYTSGDERAHAFEKLPNVTVHFKEAITGGSLGDNLEWSYDTNTNTLTISGQGPMRDFAEGEARPWDELLEDGWQNKLVIEEGVTSIGAYAFDGGSAFEARRNLQVQLAPTVERIGVQAFSNCSLGVLVFNEGLKTIDDSAFHNAQLDGWYNETTNEWNTSLIFPKSLESIGHSAFWGVSPTVVYVPASVKFIGSYAFQNYNLNLHFGGTEAQWKQVNVYADNDDNVKNPVNYNAKCPHVGVKLPFVYPTCTESGLTEGMVCGVCGEIIKEQEILEQQSHNFVDRTCTNCGMVIDPSKPLDGAIGTLNWAFDINSGKLTIDGEGAMQNYAAAENVPWNVWKEYITSVSIASTVTAIGDNAFAGLDQLKDVYFDSTQWSWQNIAMGKGNEALTNAKLHTTEAFTDVKTADWFYGPVNWAVSANVTGGLGNGLFGPNNYCTRAQVVTFLYAAAGKPEVQTTENPFTDVPDNAWYLKPVLWAVENGITGGTSATTFGPDNYCTRAQVVTFLYAAAGKPEITANSTFDDVKDSDWFAKPVIWAKENDVTGGISATQFGPNNTCTRAQVVTLLYKVYG